MTSLACFPIRVVLCQIGVLAQGLAGAQLSVPETGHRPTDSVGREALERGEVG